MLKLVSPNTEGKYGMPAETLHFGIWSDTYRNERIILKYCELACSLMASSADPDQTSNSVTFVLGLIWAQLFKTNDVIS